MKCFICSEVQAPNLLASFQLSLCCGIGSHAACRANTVHSKNKITQTEFVMNVKCLSCKKRCYHLPHPKGIKQLLKWAKKGELWALEFAGQLYDGGDGVEQDVVKAREYYQRAAENGSCGDSSYNLAGMCGAGDGGEKNLEQSKYWYEEAIKREVPSVAMAMTNLGLGFKKGLGCYDLGSSEKNINRAVELLTSAASRGQGNAQYHLGMMYFSGNGVDQDYRVARDLFFKSSMIPGANQNTAARYLEIIEHHGCSFCFKGATVTAVGSSYSVVSSASLHENCKCGTAKYCNKICQQGHWQSQYVFLLLLLLLMIYDVSQFLFFSLFFFLFFSFFFFFFSARKNIGVYYEKRTKITTCFVVFVPES